MKETLELYFGPHYLSTKSVEVISKTLSGLLTFADPKACANCKTHIDCDKAVLSCNSSGEEIEVIELEHFIDNYARLKAIQSDKKCDMLLVGNNKIVFCDMTCSKSKYIDPYNMHDGTPKIGKRNTVRKQIENSIQLLYDVPECATEMDARTKKIALFAYRIKDISKSDDFDKKISNRMRSFGIKFDKISQEPMYSEMHHGYLFTEIKYPSIYIW